MFNKQKQIDYYSNLLQEHGDHYLSLDWKSPDSQNERFKIFKDLIEMFGLYNPSILDIGSGFGDLYAYLKKELARFSYTGYDINPSLVENAKKKYRDGRFEVKDVLEGGLKTFDFVVCCGTLNISFDEREKHLDYIYAMLRKMFQLCKTAVGVNFLSSQAIYYLKNEPLF